MNEGRHTIYDNINAAGGYADEICRPPTQVMSAANRIEGIAQRLYEIEARIHDKASKLLGQRTLSDTVGRENAKNANIPSEWDRVVYSIESAEQAADRIYSAFSRFDDFV